MNETVTERKTCKNCKYARQHYTINCNLRFVKLDNEMHCVNDKITKAKFKLYFKGKEICEHWETNEQCKQEKIYKIKLLLQHFYDRLDHALQILDDMKIDE